MNISPRGLRFIQAWEGCSLKAYDDGTGVWTICWGHVEGVRIGDRAPNRAYCDKLLVSDLAKHYEPSVQALPLHLNQNQYDALVSVAYNLGTGIFAVSHDLGRYLHAGQLQKAADSLLEYHNPGSNVSAGLLRRRKAERAMFLLAPDKKTTWRVELAQRRAQLGHATGGTRHFLIRRIQQLKRALARKG